MLWKRLGSRVIPSPAFAALSCALLAPALETPAAEAPRLRVTASLANVRSEPSVHGTVVFQVKRGEELALLGEAGEWYQVEGSGAKRGYLLRTLAEPIAALPAPRPSSPAPQPPASAPAPQPQARGTPIEHKPLDCVLTGVFSRVDARFPAGDLGSARVYFRAEGRPYWYYVSMTPAESGHQAFLPKPKPDTKKIDYYVEAVARSFTSSRTQEYGPVVVSNSMECRSKMMAPSTAAAKLVVGSEAPGAPAVPEGFDAAGIAGAGAAAASAAAGGTAAASGSHTILFVAGGVAAAAGIALAAKGGSSASPSPAPIDLTGTWRGPVTGQISLTPLTCSYNEDASLSFRQSGASVNGSGTVNNISVSCPIGGAIRPGTGGGTFSGMASGGQITFTTSNGVVFTGTYTNTTMSGTLNGSFPGGTTETGTWTLTRQ